MVLISAGHDEEVDRALPVGEFVMIDASLNVTTAVGKLLPLTMCGCSNPVAASNEKEACQGFAAHNFAKRGG